MGLVKPKRTTNKAAGKGQKRPPTEKDIIAKFLSTRKILVADENNVSRAGLAKMMVNLGAKTNHIKFASNWETAKREIEACHPGVILCEYMLGDNSTLKLLQDQRAVSKKSKENLFILVTSNSSQSAVAQAAEEDVDAYILKPYTLETIRTIIQTAAINKIRPSTYMKLLEEGKELLFKGQPTEAKKVFQTAMTEDPKPALACFYRGQAELMEKMTVEAEGSYSKGLNFNKIHYKCMVGLFELLMSKNRFDEAYEVAGKISRYFPANPKRLSSILRLAIVTKSVDDIERYYQVFTKIDERTEELVKYICAALLVVGKHYFKTGVPSRGMDLFQKAAVTSKNNPKVLREIVTSMVEYRKASKAEDFLQRFEAGDQKGPHYHASRLLIEEAHGDIELVISEAMKLVKADVHDPTLYEILIRNLVKTKRADSAEQYCHKAGGEFPKEKEHFKRLLPTG